MVCMSFGGASALGPDRPHRRGLRWWKHRNESTLRSYAGKPVGVLVRTAGELAEVLAGDPFPKAPRNLTVVIFLDKAPPKDALKNVTGQKDEEVALGTREIYVYYPIGMGKSKLRIRAAETGTARNMNTVAKLVEMAKDAA